MTGSVIIMIQKETTRQSDAGDYQATVRKIGEESVACYTSKSTGNNQNVILIEKRVKNMHGDLICQDIVYLL
jgi:hypothetical protein